MEVTESESTWIWKTKTRRERKLIGSFLYVIRYLHACTDNGFSLLRAATYTYNIRVYTCYNMKIVIIIFHFFFHIILISICVLYNNAYIINDMVCESLYKYRTIATYLYNKARRKKIDKPIFETLRFIIRILYFGMMTILLYSIYIHVFLNKKEKER